jgi:hypothetical protein
MRSVSTQTSSLDLYYMKEPTELTSKVVVGPFRSDQGAFVACASLTQRAREPVWLVLCKPTHGDTVLASRILAVLVLQSDHPLIHPTVIPTAPTPACAFFLPSGEWSDQRGYPFPVEVKNEVERIATVLREQHGAYVAAMAAALRGMRPLGWSPLPPALGFADPDDECSVAPAPPRVLVDEEALGEWGTQDLLSTLFYWDYRHERYLSALSDEELSQRAADAMLNAYDYTGETQLIVDFNDQNHVQAFARLAEVMQELVLRHGAIPEKWSTDLGTRWGVKAGSKTTARALEWIKAHQGLAVTDSIIRYSKLPFLREALERGRFVIRGASGYKEDSSLNRAQTAKELEIAYDVDLKRTRVELLDKDGRQKIGDLRPTRAKVTKRAPTDAYVFCTSRRISARLLDDFGANAFLLIREREAFLERLSAATEVVLLKWEMLAFDVAYFDSFAKNAADAQPLFTKPASYQYQYEHRVIWLPPSPRFDLPEISFEIGPLKDIAEIVNLGDD